MEYHGTPPTPRLKMRACPLVKMGHCMRAILTNVLVWIAHLAHPRKMGNSHTFRLTAAEVLCDEKDSLQAWWQYPGCQYPMCGSKTQITIARSRCSEGEMVIEISRSFLFLHNVYSVAVHLESKKLYQFNSLIGLESPNSPCDTHGNVCKIN